MPGHLCYPRPEYPRPERQRERRAGEGVLVVKVAGAGAEIRQAGLVLDAGQQVTWSRLNWTANIPTGSALGVEARTSAGLPICTMA